MYTQNGSIVKLLKMVEAGNTTKDSIVNNASKFGLDSNLISNASLQCVKLKYLNYNLNKYILTEKGKRRMNRATCINTPNEPNVLKYLKAIELGYNTYAKLCQNSSKLGLNVSSGYTSCRRSGYIKNISRKYVLTDAGKQRLNCGTYFKPTVKHGTYNETLLRIISTFNCPVSKNTIKLKYNYPNFISTFGWAFKGNYITESEPKKYTLTEKGLQRLHILDMQLNDTSECMTSIHKCTNATVTEIKQHVTIPEVVIPKVTPAVIPETTQTIIPEAVEVALAGVPEPNHSAAVVPEIINVEPEVKQVIKPVKPEVPEMKTESNSNIHIVEKPMIHKSRFGFINKFVSAIFG